MRFSTPISFTFLLLFLAGCYTVPETGRTAISLIPESQLTSMAVASFQKLKEEEKVARDPALNERVRRIAEVVGDAVPAADWEFVVFADDEMLNAFVMLGGKVGVYTGMFRAARTDDELAVVMGTKLPMWWLGMEANGLFRRVSLWSSFRPEWIRLPGCRGGYPQSRFDRIRARLDLWLPASIFQAERERGGPHRAPLCRPQRA